MAAIAGPCVGSQGLAFWIHTVILLVTTAALVNGELNLDIRQ